MGRRGYFLIGIYQPKHTENIGTLWRSAYQLGATGVFLIGRRFPQQPTDTLKTARHIPHFWYETFEDFQAHRPIDCPLIAIEMNGITLYDYVHPQRAIYLLGP